MEQRTTKNSYFLIPVLLLSAGIFFIGCENDLDTIQKVTFDPKAPDEITKELNVMYNDSGYVQIRIHSTSSETFHSPEHITKLKKGLQVDFYDEAGEIVSTLTSINGTINYTKGRVVVRDSVVLHNHRKKQRLETEELFWNQNDSTIYTDKYVLIKTEGKGITGKGKGIRTTQSFNSYTILKPEGKFDLSDQ